MERNAARVKKNIFLTGRPGVGKTTVIRKVIDGLDVVIGGFYTEEIREGGRRAGFTIRGTDGSSGILAHRDLRSPYRVSRYGVNIADLERVGCGALEKAVESADCIVMDEVGSMEIHSALFREMVMKALSSPVPVLGTLQAKRNDFLDSVRGRGDLLLLQVTEENRDECPRTVKTMLADLIS